MKTFTKKLLSALFLTSLISTVPLCAIAANSNEEEVEVQEQIEETAKPWYKQSEIQKTIFVGAFTIATIYLGYKAFEHTQCMQETIIPFIKGMGRTLISGDARSNEARDRKFIKKLDISEEIKIKTKALKQQYDQDIALTKSFLNDDPNYSDYIKELGEQLLNNIARLHKQYGRKNVVTVFGAPLSDGTVAIYTGYNE